jgi:hypothetical protein
MRNKRTKLPKILYVTVEQERTEDEYIAADRTTDSKQDGDVVGIYELKETKTMRVTRTLDK